MFYKWWFLALSAVSAALATAPAAAQILDKYDRERGKQMVRDVAEAMHKHYYDPTYHGVDMDMHFQAAIDQVEKATNLGMVFGSIAAALDDLNDSHTFFVPPSRSTRRETGFVAQMVGDRCFITAVRPGTDAIEKLAPGDEVLTWEGYRPVRDTMWKLDYAFNRIYARPSLHLGIRKPDGSQQLVEVATKAKEEKRVLDLTEPGSDYFQLLRDEENEDRLNRQRFVEYGEKLVIWKMPQFEMTDEETDRIMKQARGHQFLAIDLRGNPGGLVKTLQYLVGSVMDHDVTIATRKGRKPGLKPIVAKSRGSAVFPGKLIVLVDNRSASAAELFARVVQLEHRGTVLGDHSSGMVMESLFWRFSQGTDTKIFYGASITEADLLMGDGKSLEHNGVTPDEVILPTQADIAQERDPVLSRVAELAGVALDATAAGKLFPIEWRK